MGTKILEKSGKFVSPKVWEPCTEMNWKRLGEANCLLNRDICQRTIFPNVVGMARDGISLFIWFIIEDENNITENEIFPCKKCFI